MKYQLTTLGVVIGMSVLVSACSSDSPSSQTPVATQISSTASMPSMVVYKSPTCGCCKDWVTYVEKAGFSVESIETDDVNSVKAEHGLTNPALKSCHTAIVDGYVIEGHVPLSDIERLLAERPDIVGLTAPGMPMMSPGMGSETPKDYDVLAFNKKGESRVYSSY